MVRRFSPFLVEVRCYCTEKSVRRSGVHAMLRQNDAEALGSFEKQDVLSRVTAVLLL